MCERCGGRCRHLFSPPDDTMWNATACHAQCILFDTAWNLLSHLECKDVPRTTAQQCILFGSLETGNFDLDNDRTARGDARTTHGHNGLNWFLKWWFQHPLLQTNAPNCQSVFMKTQMRGGISTLSIWDTKGKFLHPNRGDYDFAFWQFWHLTVLNQPGLQDGLKYQLYMAL